MSYLKTKAIVIKEVNFGEADKIITVISKTHGKISILAKGAKRARSKVAAATQFLCYSDFLLFKGKEMFHVNSCEVIEPFYEIRNDIIKLTYSSHMVDIIGDVIQENQPSSKVLKFFLNTLYMLSRTDKSPELIIRIFELRLLSILGYAPYTKGCIICDNMHMEKVFFSFKKCGFICGSDKCKANDEYAMEIMLGTAKAIYHIINSPMEDLFRFEVSPTILQELGKITHRYLRDRLERDYKKLDFLKSLNNKSFLNL